MEQPAPIDADRRGAHGPLSYALWLPASEPPWPGVVILHGAGSRKENHADFARLAVAQGWAALAYDQRGHGETALPMSPGAVADAGEMAALLGREPGVDPARISVRGSSMGGFVAIHAAATRSEIGAVIAICPASAQLLIEGIRRDRLEMRADPAALRRWLERDDLPGAVRRVAPKPLLLMHAEGDEQVPVAHSRELLQAAGEPKRLIAVPGGHHRSLQHDAELGAVALRWVERALAR